MTSKPSVANGICKANGEKNETVHVCGFCRISYGPRLPKDIIPVPFSDCKVTCSPKGMECNCGPKEPKHNFENNIEQFRHYMNPYDDKIDFEAGFRGRDIGPKLRAPPINPTKRRDFVRMLDGAAFSNRQEILQNQKEDMGFMSPLKEE